MSCEVLKSSLISKLSRKSSPITSHKHTYYLSSLSPTKTSQQAGEGKKDAVKEPSSLPIRMSAKHSESISTTIPFSPSEHPYTTASPLKRRKSDTLPVPKRWKSDVLTDLPSPRSSRPELTHSSLLTFPTKHSESISTTIPFSPSEHPYTTASPLKRRKSDTLPVPKRWKSDVLTDLPSPHSSRPELTQSSLLTFPTKHSESISTTIPFSPSEHPYTTASPLKRRKSDTLPVPKRWKSDVWTDLPSPHSSRPELTHSSLLTFPTKHSESISTTMPFSPSEHSEPVNTTIPFSPSEHSEPVNTTIPFSPSEHSEPVSTTIPFSPSEHPEPVSTTIPFSQVKHPSLDYDMAKRQYQDDQFDDNDEIRGEIFLIHPAYKHDTYMCVPYFKGLK